MVNVKIVTLVDLMEERPPVHKGGVVYEEDFERLSGFDLNDYAGNTPCQIIVTIGGKA